MRKKTPVHRRLSSLSGRACVATAILLSAVSCPAMAAECAGPVAHWQLCPECTYDTYKATKRNTPCDIPINLGGAADALISQQLVSRPSHGFAGQSAASYAYKPAQGFVGNDSFKMKRVFQKGNRRVVTYMIVHMEVAP